MFEVCIFMGLSRLLHTHIAYELACGDDAVCQHFRQMKRFTGDVDLRWDSADVCTLAKMQDEAHAVWMDAQEESDVDIPPYHRWVDTRFDGDHNHWLAHLCMNWKDDRLGCDTAASASTGCLVVRPTCQDRVARCPVMSCQSWIASQ